MADEVKNVVAGAMVGFKVGSQASVDTMLGQGKNANAVHGCFYLTQDSHRLYIGNQDGSISPLNEGIETLTWSELQTKAATVNSMTEAAKDALAGSFFYATDQNILCVFNGDKFVQLNQNTNTYVSDNDITVSESQGVVTVTSTVTTQDDSTSPATVATFADSFGVVGSNGITVSAANDELTIAGDTYTLSHEAVSTTGAKIKLDSTNTTNDSSVTLTEGANISITDRTTENDILISATDTKNLDLDIANGGSGTGNTDGFTITVRDTVDGSTPTGHSVSDTIDPVIKWFTDTDTTTPSGEAHFTNGVAALDVYSKAAVDSKFQAMNAMVYRGTLGSTGSSGVTSITNDGSTITVVPSTATFSIGDTFLTTTDGEYNNVSYKAGSLLIARSTDGSEVNGVIPTTKLAFDLVEEKESTDTQFKFVMTNDSTNKKASVTLMPNIGGAQKGTFSIVSGDDWIGLSAVADTTNSDDQKDTVTLTHANVTRTDNYYEKTASNPVAQPTAAVAQSAGGTIVVPIVTQVSSDAKGHITGVKTAEYTIVDTQGTLSAMSATTGAANNVGTITLGSTFTKAGGQTDTPSTSFTVSSSSLQITDADASGGAEGIAVNMVWGSF